MSIWKKQVSLAQINSWGDGNMVEHLGIRFTAIEDDKLVATMPVDERTKQPMGLLHGGASAVLAETIGSVAASLAAGDQHFCVGLEINANHLKAVRNGLVTGAGTPIRIGNSIQVWDIHISNAQGELCCVSRLTVAVRDRQRQAQA